MTLSVFETGFIAAVNNIFGNRIIHEGCYFHYTQAIYERIQLVGLTTAYKKCRISIVLKKFSVPVCRRKMSEKNLPAAL